MTLLHLVAPRTPGLRDNTIPDDTLRLARRHDSSRSEEPDDTRRLGRICLRQACAEQMDLLTVPSGVFRRWRRHEVQTGRAGLISLLWRPLSLRP